MRTRRNYALRVESLEGKALLSGFGVISQHTVGNMVHQLDRAAGTFAKTHNENQFLAKLSQISAEIPYGRMNLLPTWQSDATLYDPTVPGSGVQMVQQLKADLGSYVQSYNTSVVPPASPALPVLSHRTLGNVLHQLDRAAGTFAKTHNENQFLAKLSQISAQIPYGHSDLLPTWQADTSIYDPTVPGSGVQMVQQLKADLAGYVQTSVASGTFIYR